MNNREKGLLGENIACHYLEKNYYNILCRNFRNQSGEIDIIAQDRNTLVFIEVKSRTNFSYGRASEAVTNIKKQHILKTAYYFLYLNPHLNRFAIRFDVIEVYFHSNYHLHHLKNAF